MIRNLTDKEPEIRRRLGLTEEVTEEDQYQQAAIREMQEKGEKAVRIRLKTSIRLKDENFVPGMKIRAHLPIPAWLSRTFDVKILNHAEGKVTVDEPTSMWRSICFEDTLQENRTFFVEYEYVVWTKYLDLWHGEVSGAEDFNHVRMKSRFRA